MITNYKNYPDKKVVSIPVGKDGQWASNLKIALEKYQYPYIIYLQEDYFLTSPVNTEKILKFLEIIKKENAAYLRLTPTPPPDRQHKRYKEIGAISPEASYRASLQAAIWETNTLRNLLKDGETGWDMELGGGRERAKKIAEPFLCANKPAINYYMTGIVKGRWEYGAVKFLKKEGFKKINFNTRGVEPRKTYIDRKLRNLPMLGIFFRQISRIKAGLKRRII
ncbi:hypothetical protein A2303_04805 [Candidatus Falkowbacteria bacterium RIFOXYB2_FULL_47_14]|uniref:Glycosyltransferase 2-like domain-containing protein n=1 Tax=Candidatus Falkowbacteria bacterium RIFOXYA2_FULL_47_19 TaxID=1797994 RepID=A0A1F5SHJ0_9BACT|nr:MAG: hypothetical protein A2227_02640 [Candidatus Falkowbacteria bacterium RIFOXYA2_FULL_47_19]OGF42695.1 MAG: hypothetical protein A2303_04805 [Candidatus Falkowbacteria bacterium RIFOXYB2_FULL_47_14]